MSLNLTITSSATPGGTEFPGTVDDLLTLLAEYLGIGGQDQFNGIVVGQATPAPEDRDKPWFKLDVSGNPVGWFIWAGSAWITIPTILPTGPTASRPASPVEGQKYFDTDINRELIYDRDAWRTADGGIGELRLIDKTSSGFTSITDVLTANPGWEEFTVGAGRVLGCHGDTTVSGLTTRNAGDTVGEEEHQLTADEMPSHTHGVPSGNGTAHADGNAATGILSDHTATTTDSAGSSESHNNIQPTLFCWAIVKT